MKVFVLASGSSGNASVYESRTESVLVDAGIAPRTLGQKLRDAGAARLPTAIIITHAHNDHVGSCKAIARRLGVPVYMSESTARFRPLSGDVEVRLFSPRAPFSIGDVLVTPTPLPHDAAQVALTISDGEGSAAIATDLGEVPPGLAAHLASVDILLIESNHDVEMVKNGPYPGFLKRRILSARGHLSNEQTHALLRVTGQAAHTIVLMHLSKTNNRPDVALEVARDALAGRYVRLSAAPPDGVVVLDTAAGLPAEALPPSPGLVAPAEPPISGRARRGAAPAAQFHNQLRLPFLP